MDERSRCAVCGNTIDTGEAWMEADRDDQRVTIHSGCLYGEERGAEAEWVLQDHAAT